MSGPSANDVEIVGVHPYAEQFPMLPDDELAELAASIAANGLRNPIVITPAGLILDGRNRNAGCELAGVKPDTIVYEGDDLAEYVIDANITRRNMTTGQRAMATALVLDADGRRDNGRWQYGKVRESFAAKDSGNAMTVAVSKAGTVLDYDRDLAPRVMSGDLTLDAAFKRADELRRSAEHEKIAERERRKREKDEAAAEAERNAKIVADLTMAGSKYVELIESGALTPAAAWAAHREDTRKAREKAEAERKARSDLYSGIARGLQIIGGYGAYGDVPKLMALYDPAELYPPQYATEFEPQNLRQAARFIQELIKWQEARG